MSKQKRMVNIFNGNGSPILSLKRGRNILCECGSGLKQKKCCGAISQFFNSKPYIKQNDGK